MSQDNAESAAAHKLAEDLTGMGIPAEELAPDEGQPKAEEPKQEDQPIKEPVKEPEPEEPEGESEEDEPEEDEDEEDEEPAPAKKKSGALGAIFSQIKELRDAIDSIKSSSTRESVEEVVDEAEAFAKEFDSDPTAIKKLLDVAEKRVLAKLEKEGKIGSLPKDIQDKLELLQEYENDKIAEKEVQNDEQEWSTFLPDLKKMYPNASEHEIAEAKKTLLDIAHSKEGGVVIRKATETKPGRVKPYAFDYLVFKNKQKFDTLLKVAKRTKSGEGDGKQIRDEEDGQEDLNLDPENMTPEKMKKYQEQRMRD